MFTNNYRSYTTYRLMGEGGYTSYFTRLDGTKDKEVSMGSFYPNGLSNWSKFRFGRGDTAPTIEDYSLSDMIDSTNFKLLSSSFTIIDKDIFCAKTQITASFQYTGSSDDVINEFGLLFENNGNLYLIAREVLETPITVNNGDTFTVTMTIG